MTVTPSADLVEEALKHPAVKALYDQIQAKGEIAFEHDENYENWGSSTVNCTTKITVASTAHPAAALYHELLHAKLKLGGYKQHLLAVSMDGKLPMLKAVLEALDNELQHRRMIDAFLAAEFPPDQFYHDDDPEAFKYARQALKGLNKASVPEQFFFPFLTIIAPGGAGTEDQRKKLKNFCRSVCPDAIWEKLTEIEKVFDNWRGTTGLDPSNAIIEILGILGYDRTWVGTSNEFPKSGKFVAAPFTAEAAEKWFAATQTQAKTVTDSKPIASTVHNLPSMPAFRDERPDSPISEFALRVVVERPNWQLVVVGTATLISGHLAVTARHVLEYAMQTFGTGRKKDDGIEIDGYEIKLYQVLPGPLYRLWRVATAWACDTDIMLLHLALDRTSLPDENINWKQPRLRVIPPPVGQAVVAFGYRESKITVTEGEDGQHHIVLNDRPTTSIGVVKQVFPNGRDAVMLPFPCYEIAARFDPGMSGGMVIDESGALCGLICASLQHNDPNVSPISYVASLWPMLKTVISADRGDRYPRGVSYPVIDLAIDGLIAVNDLHALDPNVFPGKKLTRDSES